MCRKWQKYSIIAVLTRSLDGICHQFGKTALQKHIYLLQTVFDVDCGYMFKMYNFGPFCEELQDNLEIVNQWGCVNIQALSNGYSIQPGDDEVLINKSTDFLQLESTKFGIQNLIHNFGSLSASELELQSTIVFIERVYQSKNIIPTDNELLHLMRELKPKFDSPRILEAIQTLKQKQFINY